jgi:hypothetical protein
VVNSSQGGGSKDTWVLTDAEQRQEVVPPAPLPIMPIFGANPEPELGPMSPHDEQQQQQQQQQRWEKASSGPAPAGAVGDEPC